MDWDLTKDVGAVGVGALIVAVWERLSNHTESSKRKRDAHIRSIADEQIAASEREHKTLERLAKIETFAEQTNEAVGRIETFLLNRQA